MAGAQALQRPDAWLVWLLGLSMGLTACTVTCLPFMGTWIIGRGIGTRAALTDTGAFVLGRLAAYSVLGGMAGAFGSWLTGALESDFGHALIGLASIGAGVWLVLPARHAASCGAAKAAGRVPPFFLGVSLSLTPCAPLASLLAVCAVSGGIADGAGYGLAFGLGAALTPLLFILPMLAMLGQGLRHRRAWIGKWVRYGAAAVLVLLGVRRILFLM
jgi:cytochrome c-type biogenesis protein